MKWMILFPMCVAVVMLQTGCANIVRGTTEPVTVETPDCPGATCTLKNKKGTWTLVTPGSVVIPRSDDPLEVSCKKEGKVVTIQEESGVSGGAIVGDALLFGIFSAANAATDAHREYPDRIVVPITCERISSSPDQDSINGDSSKPSVEPVGLATDDTSRAYDFSGTYTSHITGNSRHIGFKGRTPEIKIVQKGNQIEGIYSYGLPGRVWGVVEGNTINFDYYPNGASKSGWGKWTFTPGSNEVKGTWNSFTHLGGGKWDLTKIE